MSVFTPCKTFKFPKDLCKFRTRRITLSGVEFSVSAGAGLRLSFKNLVSSVICQPLFHNTDKPRNQKYDDEIGDCKYDIGHKIFQGGICNRFQSFGNVDNCDKADDGSFFNKCDKFVAERGQNIFDGLRSALLRCLSVGRAKWMEITFQWS
jgi:hypothetical protein